MTAEVLTRETAIPAFTTPTGRIYEARSTRANPNLWEIGYADGKSGDLPDALIKSRYTSRKLAEDAIKQVLKVFWDECDAVIASNARNKKAA